MLTVRSEIEIDVPPHTAWALVGTPEGLSSWHPAIVSSEVTGSDRTCVLADGATLTEHIDAIDEARMSYRYTITGGPLPVEDYTSTLSIESLPGNRCKLVWSSACRPLAPEADVRALVEGVYNAGLNNARALLEA